MSHQGIYVPTHRRLVTREQVLAVGVFQSPETRITNSTIDETQPRKSDKSGNDGSFLAIRLFRKRHLIKALTCCEVTAAHNL